jgi:hypothetical protein
MSIIRVAYAMAARLSAGSSLATKLAKIRQEVGR